MASVNMKFYVTEKLGKKQSLTPEGFLLCEDVPASRTGMLIYGPNETPIEPGPEGYVKIMRLEEENFRPETLASFQGKPVTNDHPDEDVNPENWKELAVGTIINPRRGLGAYDDLMLVDMIITNPQAIKAVQEGKREVSCGYEADYEEMSPGVGTQRNIVGNHIALVESGRCGPRCAIGDRASLSTTTKDKEKHMAGKTKKSWYQRFRDAMRLKDEAGMEELLKEKEEGKTGDDESEVSGKEGSETHIHIHAGGPAGAAVEDEGETAGAGAGESGETTTMDEAVEARFAALEKGHEEIKAMLQKLMGAEKREQSGDDGESDPEMKNALGDEVPEELKEKAMSAKDSAYLVEPFKDTVSKAEILVPGITIPTLDRKAAPSQSFKKICGFRRSALDLAYHSPATRNILDELLGGKSLDTKSMTCDAIKHLFNQAAAVKTALNKDAARKSVSFPAASSGKQPIRSIAELNKRNRELRGEK